MTKEGFKDFVLSVYDHKNGTAKSYITAINIIDEMFINQDVFSLNGQSVACVNDKNMLKEIQTYVLDEQKKFKNNEDSIFSKINPKQTSYPSKGFCSAAMNQVLEYQKYFNNEQTANEIIASTKNGTEISKQLISVFNIEKEGQDKTILNKIRIGQSYFRKMVLSNYNNKCCITGLNIPQILRASHIVAWADDKKNRMNPENGLCLSATYDAAFDKHLISFDDDYRMIISKEIRDYYTNDVVKEYFGKFEGKQIITPNLYLPSKKLLEKHRELMVE